VDREAKTAGVSCSYSQPSSWQAAATRCGSAGREQDSGEPVVIGMGLHVERRRAGGSAAAFMSAHSSSGTRSSRRVLTGAGSCHSSPRERKDS
jgi:hypothetical protein